MIMRYLRLLGLMAALGVVAGCMSQPPPSNSGIQDIRNDIEKMAAVPLKDVLACARDVAEEAREVEKEQGDRAEAARLHFQAGYLYERLRKPRLAADEYKAAGKAGGGTAYQTNGQFWAAEVTWLGRADYGPDARKHAIGGYSAGSRYAPTRLFGEEQNPPKVWVLPSHQDEGWPSVLAPEQGKPRLRLMPVRQASFERLDILYRGEVYYRFMAWAVRVAGHIWPAQQWWLAIVLIAVAAKLALTPLTGAQFRSMKAMQRIQPLIKELQAKFKNDRQALAQAQMRLFKEHRVNPLGGCLPLLIQMPVLIFIYRAVDMYKFQFWGHGLLWVKNLAEPEMILLLLYAVSMYLSMRLTSTPSADPQQQQMQKMMAIMMPFMFLLILRGLPSAFILYWFVLNVLSTAHQAYILRQPVAVAPPPEPPARPKAKAKAAKRARRRRKR